MDSPASALFRLAVLAGVLGLMVATGLNTWAAPPESGILPVLEKDSPQLAEFERHFLRGIRALEENQFDAALKNFERLTHTNPDFRLAQLIYGDLLMARSGTLQGFGNHSDSSDQRLRDLLDEARTRLRYQSDRPSTEAIPEELIYLSPKVRHAIVVDLDQSRLFLFENTPAGTPKRVADYYISSGKNGADKYREGDKKTPIGLYFITNHLEDGALPDMYGAGALTLNYPNEWDRNLNKTGHGIWLHGTPVTTYSRPPRASDGCVALTNLDFLSLLQNASPGTPVILSESLLWLEPDTWHNKQEQFLVQVKRWYRDWQNSDSKRLLRHYSLDFSNPTDNYTSWARKLEHRFDDRSETGHSELMDLSIIGYPGGQPMVVVDIAYQIKGANGETIHETRRQYWRLEWGNRWKIILEEVSEDLAGNTAA
jgi:murein L,D-transpeptidase YafK